MPAAGWTGSSPPFNRSAPGKVVGVLAREAFRHEVAEDVGAATASEAGAMPADLAVEDGVRGAGTQAASGAVTVAPGGGPVAMREFANR